MESKVIITYLYKQIQKPIPEGAKFMELYFKTFGLEIWPNNESIYL
jgi:hypothetical protein